ncbi:NADH-quinone oxidoreductase subunit NuoE family protein [Algihabitans albus]|uniref:NADH-quinone oxidoreductase subunit NuoE family protein n=1 Tax=Algihabitans albus TaxID=2164067 RepID=UPI000E5CD4D0|nr:NAD(P)H-dependent oxidoreductase subunit E [Algihabitans albus]
MKVTSYRKPDSGGFAFTAENEAQADAYIARYPEGRQASAVLWLLYLAQDQNGGSIGQEQIDYVAAYLGMAPIRVHEVASFFTMINERALGRHHIQVCRTTSCWLRGSDEIGKACLEEAGIETFGGTSGDGLFTVSEVECLGACANAPMFQVNDRDYHEDLTPETARAVIRALREGGTVESGSKSGRVSSEPPADSRRTLLADAG